MWTSLLVGGEYYSAHHSLPSDPQRYRSILQANTNTFTPFLIPKSIFVNSRSRTSRRVYISRHCTDLAYMIVGIAREVWNLSSRWEPLGTDCSCFHGQNFFLFQGSLSSAFKCLSLIELGLLRLSRITFPT